MNAPTTKQQFKAARRLLRACRRDASWAKFVSGYVPTGTVPPQAIVTAAYASLQ